MNSFNKFRKFVVKKFFLDGINRRYVGTPALKIALRPARADFLLISAAFNNAELVKLQYYSLKKFLKDDYDYIVADASSDVHEAQAMESFCVQKDVGYVHLPKLPLGLDPSLYHGLALNWAFNNLVLKMTPEYFGFLEQDVFAVAPGSFLEPWRGKDFWGVKSFALINEPKVWRLFPGFCFFSRSFYENKDLNFLPAFSYHLDTGGGNFLFLKGADESHLIGEKGAREEIISKTENVSVHFFANVMHLISGWKTKSYSEEVRNKKREMVYNLIFGDKRPTTL